MEESVAEVPTEEEYEKLKERIRNADYTIANPNIQQMWKNELIRWHEAFNEENSTKRRWSGFFHDKIPMPQIIEFDSGDYSPLEMVYHVMQRDSVGMEIMAELEKNLAKTGIRGVIDHPSKIASMPYEDVITPSLYSGEKTITMFEFFEEIAEVKPDNIAITYGAGDAIKMLYQDEPSFMTRFRKIMVPQ